MKVKTKLERGKFENKECNIVESKSMLGRVNGKVAQVASKALGTVLGKKFVLPDLKNQIGITKLCQYEIDYEPIENPIDHIADYKDEAKVEVECFGSFSEMSDSIINNTNNKNHKHTTIAMYHNAYKSLKTDPVEVVSEIFTLLESEEVKKLNAVVQHNQQWAIKMAEASKKRYAENQPISILDGVPFFVKEELDCEGFFTNHGVDGLAKQPAARTAEAVQNLLNRGAILIGLTSMTVFGLSTFGFNPYKKHGIIRNPYNPEYYAGGSSGGSGSIVASNLVPFAIGVDGLGSNRIPPAKNGMVGVKATFSNVSGDGLGQPHKSFIIPGPIANNVADAALLYAAMGDKSDNLKESKERYAFLTEAPEHTTCRVPDFYGKNLTHYKDKIKFGIDEAFNYMAKDENVLLELKKLVSELENKEFTVKHINIPELQEMGASMQTIIIKELSSTYIKKYPEIVKHLKCAAAKSIITLGKNISENELTQAKRYRNRCLEITNDIFQQCNILITPVVAGLAEHIEKGDEKCGVLDDVKSTRHTRYNVLGSLAGTPSVVVNLGYTKDNLPVGVQLQARWFNEELLLLAAHYIENELNNGDRKEPKVFVKNKHIVN